jgi:acyl-CoA hydrolase
VCCAQVLSYLTGHKDLGVHTEMFSDGVMKLTELGVINNAKKAAQVGRIVAGFAMGSKQFYRWIHDNPLLTFLDIEKVNDAHTSSKHNAMTAINSCIELDLSGQVVSDSIGNRIYSGVGGQVDFIRAASTFRFSVIIACVFVCSCLW